MKITICGSIAFIDEMQDTKAQLEKLGHEVKMPPSEIIDELGNPMPVKDYYAIRKATDTTDGWIWDRKEEAMRNHFNKVVWADAILVLNHDKNNIPHYIGANTFLEMGLAFHHQKKIFLFNPIPEIGSKEEILGMRPTLINGDLSLIA
ncbi:MAG: hypothetical protein WAP52_04435 [Candidatus Sungiibacteriota bacterium]